MYNSENTSNIGDPLKALDGASPIDDFCFYFEWTVIQEMIKIQVCDGNSILPKSHSRYSESQRKTTINTWVEKLSFDDTNTLKEIKTGSSPAAPPMIQNTTKNEVGRLLYLFFHEQYRTLWIGAHQVLTREELDDKDGWRDRWGLLADELYD